MSEADEEAAHWRAIQSSILGYPRWALRRVLRHGNALRHMSEAHPERFARLGLDAVSKRRMTALAAAGPCARRRRTEASEADGAQSRRTRRSRSRSRRRWR